MQMSRSRVVVWFRNDLRIHDNILLSEARRLANERSASVVCLYCFDDRFFGQSASSFGSNKCFEHRAKFLIESVANLKTSLRALGSDLLVARDSPEVVIPKILTEKEGGLVLVQREVAYEESAIEDLVQKAISKNELRLITSDATMYHAHRLPFLFTGSIQPDFNTGFDYYTFAAIPNSMTNFRKLVEAKGTVGDMLPSIKSGDLPPADKNDILYDEAFQYMPTLSDLLPPPSVLNDDLSIVASIPSEKAIPAGVMSFVGGESAGVSRLNEWMFVGDNLKQYFETRNGLLGEAYSSKLSPWLALGCLSPRLILSEAKRYERERGIADKNTYWLIFELIVRDFFRYYYYKVGRSMFFVGGAEGRVIPWKSPSHDGGGKGTGGGVAEAIRRWKVGMTGVPFVDANMRELLHTGWMSNRGRQNVASFFVHDLGIDWRIGAAHFESFLIDHDVYSNYGNWNSIAGLMGGRLNVFNVTKQGKDYDPNAEYIKHWLPELKNVPLANVFEPWKHANDLGGVVLGRDYPLPLATSARLSIAAAGAKNSERPQSHSNSQSSYQRNARKWNNNNNNNNNSGYKKGGA